MLLAAVAIVAGLVVLVWSADRFVDGAAATANYLGMSPLLIGMVIVGFGTSAPELVVSAIAASQGNPGLALGNAYGSNITNIALILGVVALIKPIAVDSGVLRREIPLLGAITLLCGWQLLDGNLSRLDALVLMAVFFLVMGWSIRQGMTAGDDPLATEMSQELAAQTMSLKTAILWLIAGLLLLVASSRLLVWGAVEVAHGFGVSDLVIGLTIVAVGTSLPELASSLAAIRKGEHDLAIGNVIGSNLFNTLAVVGIAAGINPLTVDAVVLYRDWMVMAALTLLLFVFSFGFRGPGRINRVEAGVLLAIYVGYTGYLIQSIVAGR